MTGFILDHLRQSRRNAARKMLLAGSAALAIALPIATGLLQVPPALAQPASTRTAPSPGTEAALRRFIAGEEAGNPPYDLLTSDLADRVHQVPAPDWGALKSLTFKAASGNADTYEAQFEKEKLTFFIGALTPDGKISTLGYVRIIERAPGTENSPSPGVQQALRQLLDGYHAGQVPFEILGDAIAARLRNGQTPLGDENTDTLTALGPVQSLTFLKVDASGDDTYLATYPHGHATWVIPPLVNGKIDNLLWGNILIDAPAHPGTEDAVRNYINLMQNGEPDYSPSKMTPARAAQERRAAAALKKLGALNSLTFKGGGGRNMDLYEAKFANGAANFLAGSIAGDQIQVTAILG